MSLLQETEKLLAAMSRQKKHNCCNGLYAILAMLSPALKASLAFVVENHVSSVPEYQSGFLSKQGRWV